jgi:hypothetical protein
MVDPTKPDAAGRTARTPWQAGWGPVPVPGDALPRVGGACYPIYEAAQAAGAIVFGHFGILKMGIRDKLGFPAG